MEMINKDKNEKPEMIIFMSGGVSGIHPKEVMTTFDLTKKYIEQIYSDKNVKIISPLDNGLEWNEPWHAHMIECLKMFSKCTHLFQIPNWKLSVGATIEDIWADRCGIKKIKYDLDDYTNFINSNIKQ